MENESILSKVVITGATGMVGSYVDFGIKTDRRSLDITDLKEVTVFFQKHKPTAVVHLAAETDVDRCERDPEYAYLTNGVGTYNLTVAARGVGAKLIYVSTAGVFDGEKNIPYDEADIPNPKNYYGHSKYLGELAVSGNLDNFIIARACWMMGGGPAKDQKFVSKIIQQLRDPAVKEIKAINDQVGTPTYGKDLIGAIKKLILEDRRGIFHLSNTGTATRYDVAQAIVKMMGSNVEVSPVDSSFFNLDAKRTKNEVIVSREKLMRPWEDALKEYLNEEWK